MSRSTISMKHPVQLKTELIPQEFDPDRLDQITNVVLVLAVGVLVKMLLADNARPNETK